jgi:2,3,4,5-tetrahydropyridine-2,6-dicarboxylate N-succinyltransferase
MTDLKNQIEAAYVATSLSPDQEAAVEKVMKLLEKGEVRVAEKKNCQWQTNAWVKQAILLLFKVRKMEKMSAGPFSWLDKIRVQSFELEQKVRTVPPSFVREGAFISPSAILMPSYVNIGAYVGKNTMVDTWATVGSCAQVGDNVHLSGGVGLGGVLEPLQAEPVIIEDDVFVGSRCIVVEGVRVEQGAVLGAGVVLTKSTKIIDVREKTAKTAIGVVPERAVVIPGTVPKEFPAGTYQTPCALIIGTRSAKTDSKTSLNQALRDFEVSI